MSGSDGINEKLAVRTVAFPDTVDADTGILLLLQLQEKQLLEINFCECVLVFQVKSVTMLYRFNTKTCCKVNGSKQ